MSKTATKLDKMIKDSTEFSSNYSDACTKSTSILMKGLEDIVGTAMSLVQNSTEKQTKFVKAAMSSKNINDFADIQTKIVQENYDDLVAGATKISEISAKILTDSAEPVSAELNKVIQKATDAMAA